MAFHADFFHHTRIALPRPPALRWTARRTILFTVFSSLALWAGLILSVRALIG